MSLFKPRITLLADRPGWAFDNSAQEIVQSLASHFNLKIEYVVESPILDPNKIDLLYVFFWGEDYHKKFNFSSNRIIKLVSSHRWMDDPRYGPYTPLQFAQTYLADCDTVACSSLRLFSLITDVHPKVYHVKHGFAPSKFSLLFKREGPMKVGWAGNAADELKGYSEILLPACGERFPMLAATGDHLHQDMNRFYNGLDIFAVTSRHEGEPLTLIEAMAAGCFPVCTNVGIVPEVIRHQENGLIVNERTPQKFAEAFAWCEQNLERIRGAGEANAREMLQCRSWDICANSFEVLFNETLKRIKTTPSDFARHLFPTFKSKLKRIFARESS